MFKSAFALVVGVLVFVGCREAKIPSSEPIVSQAELADREQVYSMLAKLKAATNAKEETVAFWPFAIHEQNKKWPKTTHQSESNPIEVRLELNPDPYEWSKITGRCAIGGSMEWLRIETKMAKLNTGLDFMRDKLAYGSEFGEGEGANHLFEWKTTETVEGSNHVVSNLFRLKR